MNLTGTEWVIAICFYAMRVVLPILVLVAAVLVIIRTVRGVKARDTTSAGGQKAAETAVQAEERAAREASEAAARSGDDARAIKRELLQARVALALADAGLTKRERTVLLEAAGGKSLAQIAEELSVSRSTVGTYCARAYEKLGVAGKEGAAAWIARAKRGFALRDRGLSEDEAETALLVAEGASTAEVASTSMVAEATVCSRLQRAYKKLDIHSREELAELIQGIPV